MSWILNTSVDISPQLHVVNPMAVKLIAKTFLLWSLWCPLSAHMLFQHVTPQYHCRGVYWLEYILLYLLHVLPKCHLLREVEEMVNQPILHCSILILLTHNSLSCFTFFFRVNVFVWFTPVVSPGSRT